MADGTPKLDEAELSRLFSAVNPHTPESLEQQLNAILKRWRQKTKRKLPRNRNEWKTALRMGGLNDASLTVLFTGDNLSQATGLWGYLATLIPRPRPAKHPNDQRDRWLYGELSDVTKPLKSTLGRFQRQAELKDWEPIGTIEGIKRAANRYAERHSLDALPKRTRR